MAKSIGDQVLTASGRLGRGPFALLGLILLGLWTGYSLWLAPSLPGLIGLSLGLGLSYLAACLVSQRLHDIGLAGWWGLLIFAALALSWRFVGPSAAPLWSGLVLVGLSWLAVIPGQIGCNRYGHPPGIRDPRPVDSRLSQDQRSTETTI